MDQPDYESLLADAATLDFYHCSDDEFSIFVEIASNWLYWGPRIISPTIVRTILKSVADIFWAVPYRNRERPHDRHTFLDAYWIQGLHTWQESEPRLLECFGAEFRRLLHAIEKAFLANALSPQAPSLDEEYALARAKEYLHTSLEKAHQGLDVCERPSCQWLHHGCEEWQSCALFPLVSIESSAYVGQSYIHPY